MRAFLVIVGLLLSLTATAGPPPPNDDELTAIRARAAGWRDARMAPVDVALNLRLWYGRFFTVEIARSGEYSIFVITFAWSDAVLQNVEIHRALVIQMDAPE